MTLRPILLLVVLAAVGAALSPAQTGQTQTTVRHHRVAEDPAYSQEISSAEDAMAKKDFASAEKTLAEVTTKDPNNYRAWFDLGYVYNATDRPQQSIDAYRKSVTANPTVFESTLNLGIMLARAGDPDAEKVLRQATTLKPSTHQEEGSYRAWLTLGHVVEKTKPQEAIEAFQNAAKLQPKEAEPHLSTGLLLEQQKQYSQAAAEYQKAADLDPKSAEALAGLVNTYSQAGQLTEAETALHKFVELDPKNATAHIQLGRLLAAQHKWDEATAELDKGLQFQPGDIQAERQLASIYLDQKQYDQAIPHIEAALKAAPRDAQLHHWMGQALLAQKRFSEAQNELITALKLKPDLGEAYGDLAFAASENKNYPLVVQALDVRAKYLPEGPISYFLRATAYDHLHDAKQAAANYHKFLELAQGRYPDEEWKAKHRLIAIEPKR
ncbi:MAG: tetratricopeptide repeat protein [Terriglobales bacterium]